MSEHLIATRISLKLFIPTCEGKSFKGEVRKVSECASPPLTLCLSPSLALVPCTLGCWLQPPVAMCCGVDTGEKVVMETHLSMC